MPDGCFAASPEGFSLLSYTNPETLESVPAAAVRDTFYRPERVEQLLESYLGALPSIERTLKWQEQLAEALFEK